MATAAAIRQADCAAGSPVTILMDFQRRGPWFAFIRAWACSRGATARLSADPVRLVATDAASKQTHRVVDCSVTLCMPTAYNTFRVWISDNTFCVLMTIKTFCVLRTDNTLCLLRPDNAF